VKAVVMLVEHRTIVARMERSGMRDRSGAEGPDFATLHPGYDRNRSFSR
jgi:hypothetical protein